MKHLQKYQKFGIVQTMRHGHGVTEMDLVNSQDTENDDDFEIEFLEDNKTL